MIKLYPVLVANSVSKNIIPGILKSVERFALIYRLDELARDVRKNTGISLTKVGNKIVVKESDEEIVAYLANEILSEQGGWQTSQRHGGSTKQQQIDRRRMQAQFQKQRQRQKQSQNVFVSVDTGKATPRDPMADRRSGFEKEIGKRMATPADTTISIGQFDMKSIMLEPTWMKIDRITRGGMKVTSILGVKAVPVSVKSDASLAQLLSFDKQVGRMMHLILKFGRQVTGLLYRIYARTIQRMFDPDPEAISGDPYKDIVLKRTIIKEMNIKDVFLVLNQADLEEDFAVDAKGIRKLMSLGWQSFCIADDVNRRLTFCMREFRGMCQTLPYTMIYQTLDQAKVFEDLEDVRRASSSLFKTKIPMKKVLGESLAQHKLEEFGADIFGPLSQGTQEFLNEIAYIDENFAATAKKVMQSPKQFLGRLFQGTAKVPRMTIDRALKMGRKIDPQFPKAYALAKRVLNNSIKAKGLSEEHLNWAAMTVVIRAKTLPGKDLMGKTKEVLMSVIPLFRKALRKAQETTLNIPPQHRVEAVFGLVSLFLLTTILGFFYTWSMIMSLKVKPYVEPVMKVMSDFFATIFAKVKYFVTTDGEVQLKDLFNKLTTEFKNLMTPYHKQVKDFVDTKTGEGGVIDNLKDTLKNEYDMSFGELGALMILTIVGIYSLRFILRK